MLDFLIPKVYAQGSNTPFSGSSPIPFNTLLARINDNILTPIIYLLFALALLYFLWGVFKFIRNADNSEEREVGGKHILWGVIGLLIMFSVKGIINLVLSTIGAR